MPVDQLPNFWNLPLKVYLERTHTSGGWSWLGLIAEGDFASLLGIAWLSGCSVVCLLAILPIYLRRNDWVYVAICVIALAVQLLAASGLLTGEHSPTKASVFSQSITA